MFFVVFDPDFLAPSLDLVDGLEVTGKDVNLLVIIVRNRHIMLTDNKSNGGLAGLVLRLFFLRFGIELHHIAIPTDQVGIVAIELDDPVVHIVHMLHVPLCQPVFDHRDRLTLALNDKVFLLGITHTDT